MERASKFMGKLKLSAQLPAEELAIAAWPVAVGKRIAFHSTARCLVRDRLVVEVDDGVWKSQLFQLRLQILENLAEIIGPELVRDVEFRIAPPRRPAGATAVLKSERTESADEADSIRDPVLRQIYKEQRKKASA
ncbi:MAG TPA: DUF721 domain-containing protein [Bryobacteraceae bacterium]|nr:DUF721 domain-containing protein [Bryobacteraceae bacterium]